MRLIAWREGGATDTSRDHEYADWRAVERFAGRCLDSLPEPGRPPAAPGRAPEACLIQLKPLARR